MAEVPTVEAHGDSESTNNVLDAIERDLKAIRAIANTKQPRYFFNATMVLKQHTAKLLDSMNVEHNQEPSASSPAVSSANLCPSTPTQNGVDFEDLFDASPPRPRDHGMANSPASNLALISDPNNGTPYSEDDEEERGDGNREKETTDDMLFDPLTSENNTAASEQPSMNNPFGPPPLSPCSCNRAPQDSSQAEMNTLNNALGHKRSLRSMKNKEDESHDANITAPAGVRREIAESQVANASKERLRWSREKYHKEFNNTLAPSQLNEVEEQTRYDALSDSEINLEGMLAPTSKQSNKTSTSSGHIQDGSTQTEVPPSILKAPKRESVFVSSVPGMLLPSSTAASSELGKRRPPPAQVNKSHQAKKFKKASNNQPQSLVLLVFDIEEEYTAKGDTGGQMVSIEVSETMLRQNSRTINALLVKKEESKGTFDPQDDICWLPRVSRSKLARGVATIYMIPFINYVTSNGHAEAKELLQWSAGILFDLFQHWWKWVKEETFGGITSPWRKDRVLMMGDALGASAGYVEEVQNHKTYAKHYMTEEEDMAYRNKHHPTRLIHEDPAMYQLLKAKGSLWRKTN
ncbi:hypothetical protein BKA65DRAFT_486064 [Rhexocercosporidium sp. MPI-PUGE-AT-0058]|nr:hypothetical protein BKA65DRAFT_486064 [Rhexocercosporidium sp. MPI-PUGE-AT-0058]